MDTDIVALLTLRIQSLGQEQLVATGAELRGLGDTATAQGVRVRDGLAVASTAMIGIGAAVSIVGGVAVKAAMDFQSSMEMIATNAGASQAEVKGMSAAVLQMAQVTGTAPDKLALGLYHIESAGIRGAVALDTLRAAAEGAKIGHADLEDVTNALIGVENSHIAGVHGEIDAMAALNAIVGSGNMHLQDLTAALATGVLPAARTAGLTLQDVGAALAVMTVEGIPASRAATQLSMTIAKMEAPNKAAADAFASIGLSTTQLAVDMRKPDGLLVALTDLKAHLEAGGRSAVSQAQIIVQAFGGGRMSKGVMELLGSLDQLQKKYAEQASIAGQFAEDWIRTEQTTAAGMDHLRANVDVLAITLGDALLPAVNSVLGDVAPAVGAMDTWAKSNRDLVRDLMLAGVAVGALGVTIKGVQVGMSLYETASTIAGKSASVLAGTTAVSAQAAAAARPNWTALNVTMDRLAVILPELSTALLRVGVGAAASTPEVGALNLALNGLRATSSGLLVPLAAMPAELATTDAALAATTAEVDATTASMGGRGLMGAMSELSLGPAGWIMLAATAGVVAYTTLPAVRSAVNDLAAAFEQKLYEGALVAQMGLAALTEGGKSAGDQAEATSGKLDLLKKKANDLFGVLQMGAKSAWDTSPIGVWGNAAGSALDHLTQKQRDYNALVAEGQQRLKDYYALQKGVAEAAGGGVSKLAIQVSASDFSKTVKTDTSAYQTDLAALADQLVNGTNNLQGFVEKTANAQTALQTLTDAQTQAAVLANLASGKATDAVTQFVSSIRSKATEAIDLWAVGLVKGTGNVKQLEAAAVQRAQTEVLYNAKLKQVNAAIDKQVPGYADLTAKLKTATQAAADFATALNQKASRTFDLLVENAFKGKASSDKQFEAAVRAAEKTNLWSLTSDKIRLRVDEAAGNWAAALTDMRKLLDDQLSAAQGKLQVDRSRGAPAAVIAGDTSAVSKAQQALRDFEAQTKKSTKAVNDFTTEQTAADKKTKAALDAYAEGLLTHAKDLPALRAAYIAAGGESAKFARALTDAEAALRAHQSAAARLQQEQTDAGNKLANAEAVIVLALERHRQVTDKMIAAAEKDQAAVNADAGRHWDAAFAAASVADKHSLLVQREQSVISHFSSLESATQSVIDAHATLARDEAALSDDVLKLALVMVTDLSALGTAQSTASNNQASQVVKAIDDETAAITAQGGVLSAIWQQATAGHAQSIAAMAVAIDIARQQLAETADQTANDLAAAQQQTVLDADNIRIAQDKLNVDMAQANAAIQLARDQIAVDRTKLKLAQDQLKLTELTNDYVRVIAAHFGDVKAFDQQTAALLRTIATDTTASNNAMTRLAKDTATFGQVIDRLNIYLAQDQAKLATDTSASNASSIQGQQVIAQDKERIAAEQQLLQSLQALDQATQAVTAAENQLASDQSKALIDGLSAMVTAVNDATAVLSAQASVSNVGGSGMVKAVQDQSAIITAQGAVANATTAQARQIAQDQLMVALDQLSVDRQDAQWAQRIAVDQVKIALDKQAADALKAGWDQTIDMDTLKLDHDKIKLAEDQLQLAQINNVIAESIAQALGVNTDALDNAVAPVLAQINADQAAIGVDQAALLKDQQTAAQQEAASMLQAAQDAQQLARDQAASDASSQAGQMRIALDNNRLAADNVAATKAVAAAIQQQDTQLANENKALLGAIALLRGKVQHGWVGSGNNAFLGFYNGLGASMGASQSPP